MPRPPKPPAQPLAQQCVGAYTDSLTALLLTTEHDLFTVASNVEVLVVNRIKPRETEKIAQLRQGVTLLQMLAEYIPQERREPFTLLLAKGNHRLLEATAFVSKAKETFLTVTEFGKMLYEARGKAIPVDEDKREWHRLVNNASMAAKTNGLAVTDGSVKNSQYATRISRKAAEVYLARIREEHNQKQQTSGILEGTEA